MLASKIACPNCRTGFRAASSLTAGQKVKCPKCGAYFTMPGKSSMLTGGQQRPLQTRKDFKLMKQRTHPRTMPIIQEKGRGKLGLAVVVMAVVLVLVVVLAGGLLLMPIVFPPVGNNPGAESRDTNAPAGEVAKKYTGKAQVVSGGSGERNAELQFDKDGKFLSATGDVNPNKSP